MKIEYPGLCFLRSDRPVAVNTDGVTTSIRPSSNSGSVNSVGILVLPVTSAKRIQKQERSDCVSLYSSIEVSDAFNLPEVFDGSQDMRGKKVLIIMVNGWGDMILVQPAFRLLYEEIARTGDAPRITLACDWVKNFPYLDAHYISGVRPNILTVRDLRNFDIMISLAPLNHQRVRNRSMKDLYLEAFGIAKLKDRVCLPSISPDPQRVNRLRPFLDEIRSRTGKRLLYINWKSRFSHKDASPELAFEIARRLADQYHAVFFKDRFVAGVMEQEVRACKAPVQNLSHLIGDLHDTVAAISLIDAIISVDTGVVHAAGALGVPGVALFGPFPPGTHIADYPSIIGVRSDYQGSKCKGPCEETHRGCAEIGFAANRISPCFEAIKPYEVIDTLKEALTFLPS